MPNVPVVTPEKKTEKKQSSLGVDLAAGAAMLVVGAIAAALAQEITPRFAFMLLGGAIVGAIVGLLPFFIARKRGRTRFGNMSLAGCAVAGMVLGIVLALPVSVVLTIIIMKTSSTAPLAYAPGAETESQKKPDSKPLLIVLCGFAGLVVVGLLVAYVATNLSTSGASGTRAGGAPSGSVDTIRQNGDKVEKTMADVRVIGIVCESINVDYDQYPDVDSPEELAELAEPLYVKKLPRDDAWGRRYLIATHTNGYQVRSMGADGIPDTKDDIVYSNGSFVTQ